MLGAGNMSMLIAGDVLHALFVENDVVLLKMSPQCESLTPVIRDVFAPLIELGALAVALTSSVFALIAYAGLEAMKIRVYGRLLGAIGDVEALYRQADARREQTNSAAAGIATKAAATA